MPKGTHEKVLWSQQAWEEIRNQTFQGLIESQDDLIGVGQALDDTGVKAPKILQKAPIFFFGSHKVPMKNDTGPIGFEGGLEKKTQALIQSQ